MKEGYVYETNVQYPTEKNRFEKYLWNIYIPQIVSIMLIFVSSPYSDLENYRRVVESSLRMSGYDFVGMEHFGAQNNPPLEVCLNAVKQSDVFVGIMGMRYGSSPPSRVLSYTEREYNLAYSLRLPIYMFLIDETRARIRPADFETNPEKVERLRRFKEKVRRRHTITHFCSEDNLAWLILASLRIEENRIREAE
jgi:hypothetical protein